MPASGPPSHPLRRTAPVEAAHSSYQLRACRGRSVNSRTAGPVLITRCTSPSGVVRVTTPTSAVGGLSRTPGPAAVVSNVVRSGTPPARAPAKSTVEPMVSTAPPVAVYRPNHDRAAALSAVAPLMITGRDQSAGRSASAWSSTRS